MTFFGDGKVNEYDSHFGANPICRSRYEKSAVSCPTPMASKVAMTGRNQRRSIVTTPRTIRGCFPNGFIE